MDPFYNLCFVFVFVIPCIIVATCRERDELLALLRVMCFFCAFVTFPYGAVLDCIDS